MRQQKGQEFKDDDDLNFYRWDISENLIYRVEQRIYSWVPNKGYITMVIDEGKSILIDDPKDTDNHQEKMKARIKNNIVAYGSVDAIRLKSTPNLEVSNNSVFQVGPDADGITDKDGDTSTPTFKGFICKNNAVQTVDGIFAIEIDDCVSDAGSDNVSGNVAMTGKTKPNIGTSKIKRLTGGQLFTDPANGDFSINSALGLPSSLGVESGVLTALGNKATAFGAKVGASGFEVDHLKLSQTIFDNIPNLNDGIDDNEEVFVDNGTVKLNDSKPNITYKVVVGGWWQRATKSPNKQEMRLNKEYLNWYRSMLSKKPGYPRYRWGDSEVMQNQAFVSDWLTVSQIKGKSDYTQINGYDNDFTLDGDDLGINSITRPSMNIIPNPSEGSFLLEAKNTIENIQFVNIQGESLTQNLSITRTEKGYQINTNNLSPGIYILKADNTTTRVVIR